MGEARHLHGRKLCLQSDLVSKCTSLKKFFWMQLKEENFAVCTLFNHDSSIQVNQVGFKIMTSYWRQPAISPPLLAKINWSSYNNLNSNIPHLPQKMTTVSSTLQKIYTQLLLLSCPDHAPWNMLTTSLCPFHCSPAQRMLCCDYYHTGIRMLSLVSQCYVQLCNTHCNTE